MSDAEGTGWMKQVIGRSAKKTKNVEKYRISYAGAGLLKPRGPTHTTRAKFDPRIDKNVSDKLRRRRNSEKRAQTHDESEI